MEYPELPERHNYNNRGHRPRLLCMGIKSPALIVDLWCISLPAKYPWCLVNHCLSIHNCKFLLYLLYNISNDIMLYA